MLTPKATASGTTTRRCSRRTRCISVSPYTLSATSSPRPNVDASYHRHEQALLVGFLGRREHVAEAARFLERFDEGVEILRPARLHCDVHDELSLRGQH